MLSELSLALGMTVDEVAEGVIIISPDYKLVYASPSIFQMTGLSDEVLHTRSCFQVLGQRETPCERDALGCPLPEIAITGAARCTTQIYFNNRKEKIPFLTEWHPLRTEEGTVAYVVGIVKNMNTVSAISSRVERLVRFAAMGELFHGIGHNLNTPLSAVMARGEMLVERLKRLESIDDIGNDKGRSNFMVQLGKSVRDAEVIVANATKLSEIIRNMMYKGVQENDEAPHMLNLNTVLKEELKFLESDMRFKHEIEKKYYLDESVPCIEGVYHHFSQSITYLIRNAMDAVGHSEVKKLTINSRYDKNNIFIEIKSKGKGTPFGTEEGHNNLIIAEMRLNRANQLLKLYGAEAKVTYGAEDILYYICIPCK